MAVDDDLQNWLDMTSHDFKSIIGMLNFYV